MIRRWPHVVVTPSTPINARPDMASAELDFNRDVEFPDLVHLFQIAYAIEAAKRRGERS